SFLAISRTILLYFPINTISAFVISLIWQCLLFASLAYLIGLDGADRQELRYKINRFRWLWRTYRIRDESAVVHTPSLLLSSEFKTKCASEESTGSLKIAFVAQALPYLPS